MSPPGSSCHTDWPPHWRGTAGTSPGSKHTEGVSGPRDVAPEPFCPALAPLLLQPFENILPLLAPQTFPNVPHPKNFVSKRTPGFSPSRSTSVVSLIVLLSFTCARASFHLLQSCSADVPVFLSLISIPSPGPFLSASKLSILKDFPFAPACPSVTMASLSFALWPRNIPHALFSLPCLPRIRNPRPLWLPPRLPTETGWTKVNSLLLPNPGGTFQPLSPLTSL